MTDTSIDDGQLYINGKFTEASSGRRFDVTDPSTGAVVGTVADADPADVDTAVAAARLAFDEGPWPKLSGRERARILHKAADLVRGSAEEIVRLESLDVGKPVSLCLPVDVLTTAEQYEYYSALAQSVDGATRQIPINAHAYTRREPLGVVAAITPFNFPLILSTSKIAPALAAGNVVVHKPAEDTPLSALFMASLLSEAGVPDGAVNVVTGHGSVIGDTLLEHPGIDKIAFTGSTAVGRHAAAVAGRNLKPVTMELGGNAANIVFADADLDKAIGAVIKGFVFNTGQFCMGGPRLLIARELYDTVLGILAQAVPGVPVGDPRDPATVVGPMAGARHLEKVEEYVALARHDGGRIMCGGSASISMAASTTARRSSPAWLTTPASCRRRSSGRSSPSNRSTPRARPSLWRTAPVTDWPRGSRRPIWPGRTGSRPGFRPASSGSTTGPCSTRRSRSAGSRTPASAANTGLRPCSRTRR